jgi:hypothetical protein
MPQNTDAFDGWTIRSNVPGPSDSTTVVFLTDTAPRQPWMKRVSKNEKNARSVFLEPDGDAFRPYAYFAGDLTNIETSDLETAAAAAAHRSPPLDQGEITFRKPEGPQQFKLPPKGDADPTKIFTQEGLEAQIKARNIDVINSLVRQVRSPLGVIPFVGAGMSAAIQFPDLPPGFPQWPDLLLKMAMGTTKEAEVRQLVSANKYELAAQFLNDRRPGVLPLRIRDAFDREVDRAQLVSGALSYLPALASGPVITTNFDRVLEQVFDAAGKPLYPVYGPQPDAIVNAIHQNQRALLKIHGDCCDRTFQVLTETEYLRAYGIHDADSNGTQNSASISSLAQLMFTNRPLFCLGCSLEADRTTEVLRGLQNKLPGLTHYAILAGHYSLHRWEERERSLDQMGVRTLWFAPDQFGEIEALLREVLERSSTRKLSRVNPVLSVVKTPADNAVSIQRFRDLEPKINAQPLPDNPVDVLQAVTRIMLEGKLAFFLGAYAHLQEDLLGKPFYEELAQKFNVPLLSGDRSAVASFVVSRYGRGRLWSETKAFLARVLTRPSPIHQFLAALPGLLRATHHENAAPLWVFTTNYDTTMEQALTAAGERFHLLYYNGGTAEKYHGLFIERSAEGVVRVIERPDNLRSLDPASNVIVKFNGGLVQNNDFSESVLTATSHFEQFAAAIPAALPLYVRNALQERSLLFLGHGLAEPDVQALIRHSASEDRTIKSWAIQHLPNKPDPDWLNSWQERRDHFRSWGLQTVICDLRDFVGALHQELVNTLLPASVTP